MRVFKRILPAIVVLLAALLLLYLPDVAPERYGDLETYFRMELDRQGLGGYVVVAVARDQPDFLAAFGTDGAGKPLTIDQPLPLGPLTESFTGLVVRSLEAEGRFVIDRPLGDYLPDFTVKPVSPETDPGLASPLMGLSPVPVVVPPVASPAPGDAAADSPRSLVPQPLTARLFLAMRSGYSAADLPGEAADLPGEAADLPGEAADDPSRLAAAISAMPRRDPPGAVRHDFPAGYRLVAQALERTADKPYSLLLRERVLRPLGMRQTYIPGEVAGTKTGPGALPAPGDLPRGSASFFGIGFARDQPLEPAEAASAHLAASARDLMTWLAWLCSPGTSRTRLLPQPALPGLVEPLISGGDYGYGWTIDDRGGGAELARAGSIEAFQAAAAIWPGYGAGIAIVAPRAGLVAPLFVMPGLIEGARSLMLDGEARRGFPHGRLTILLAITAGVMVFALLLQIGDALAWARHARSLAGAAGHGMHLHWTRFRTWAGMAVRIGIAVAAPQVLGMLLDAPMDWERAFSLEPGYAAWAAFVLGLGVLRNLTRLAWLR